MASTEDIILRIALSGQDDVVARLGQIGDAGVGAMERIERAVTGGSAIFAGLTAAVTGAAAGIFYWANSSSTAIDKMANLASQSGTTISQISALSQTLSAAGADTDTLGTAFRRLAFTTTGQWTQIAQAVKKGVNDTINEQYKLKDSALAVEDAQEKLYQSQLKQQQLLGVQQDPREKQAHDLANAYRDVERAQNDLAKAERARVEALEAAEERQRNSIETLRDAVKSIAEGRQTFAQAGQTADLTFENVIKGVIASAGTAGDAIKNFSGNLSDLIGKGPTVKDVFFQLADFMKNSGDDALNTALAYRVLGRGVGQDVVEAMKQGSTALQAYMDNLERLGLVLTDTDKKVAQEFIRSFRSLSGELVTTIQKIGTFFAPAFTEGFNNFRKFIEDNHQSILRFAQDVANSVKPIILDFFNVISGQDAKTEWVQNLVDGLRRLGQFIRNEVVPAVVGFFNYLTGGNSDPGSKAAVWQERFQKFGEAVKTIFNTVVGAIGLVISALDKATGLFNKIFGTDISAADIGIVLVLAKITGALGLLTAAINTTFSAASKLFGLFRAGALAGGAAELAAAAGGGGGGVARGLLGTVGTDTAAAAAGAAGGAALGAGAKAAAVALAPGEFVKAAAAAMSAGFAQAVGISLGTVGLVTVVSAGLTALLLSAIDKAKAEQDKLRKGRAGEDTPANEVPLPGSALEYLFGIKPAQTIDDFREEQRTRRLGFAADRDTAERELTERQRQSRDTYLDYGREQDLRGLNRGLTPRGGSEAEQSRLLDLMMGRGAETTPGETGALYEKVFGDTANKNLQAAEKQLQAADKQMKKADDVTRPGKGWSREDQRAFEIHGGPDADYYARFGVQVADPRGGGGDVGAVGSEAQQATAGLDSLGSAAEGLASVFESTAGSLQSVADRLASIELPEPQHAAEGGLIVGPGGPKEDRVPAMLSPGEYVITADGSNLADAMRHFGKRFAEGGFVSGLAASLSMPNLALREMALASRLGGAGAGPSSLSPLRPLSIVLGGATIPGLYGTSRAVSDLQRAAVDQQVSSIGRKPSWYG